MTAERDFDRQLHSWFEEMATTNVPAGLMERSFDRVGATRQRPGWLVRDRGRRPQAVARQTTAPAWAFRVLALAVAVVVVVAGAGLFLKLAPALIGGPSSPPSILPVPSITPAPSASVAPSSNPTAAVTAAPNPTASSGQGPFIAFTRGTEKVDPTGHLCSGPFAGEEATTCSRQRLWIVGSDGTGAHELFPAGTGSQSALSWSPDGARLLYSDNGNLYLTDLSGGEPQPVGIACVDICGYDSPAFSSDGRHLVFSRSADNGSGIATLDLATGRVAGLSSTAPDGGTHPGWSPDGQHIVFSREAGETSKAAVFVVDADGQNLRQITPTTLEAQSGQWSPDGSRIVFTSPETQGTDIYTVRPDGTDLRQLTTYGISSAATWTPDGRILFVRASSPGGTDGFWTMDADGTNAARLVPGAALGVPSSDPPLWQPSGGPAILPPPWNPSSATPVGPPPPTPVATPPALAEGFSATGSMQAAIRDWPAPPDGGYPIDTATVLTDGRVLVTRACDPTAELYDPLTGTFSATGPMTVTRSGTSATRLLDGRVLITGGYNCGNAETEGLWASAELFDPQTATFSPTGSMAAPRAGHTATLLADGRVLITGGSTGAPPPVAFQVVFASYQGGSDPSGHLAAVAGYNMLASAEVYDPTTGTFTPTGSMSRWRDVHTSTLLQDGRVLVVGGNDEWPASLTSAELYDPTAGTFSDTGSLVKGRWFHTATLLQDGRVLITGGKGPNDKSYASAELYDPTSGKFSSTSSMSDARQGHTATLLQDGRVLIAGGYPIRRPELDRALHDRDLRPRKRAFHLDRFHGRRAR